MPTFTRIFLPILAILTLGASCVQEDYAKPAASQDYEPTFEFDCDPTDEDPGGPYYAPNFTATVSEPEPGKGYFVVNLNGDQRSCDMANGMATMTVTVDGVEYCNEDAYLLAYTCVLDNQPIGQSRYVEVAISWREVTAELLWSGWINNLGV